MLCRVCTRQPVRSPPARSAPAAAIALTRPEGRLSQAQLRTLHQPWLQNQGGSASRICPGYNNQILFCIGGKDGLPWKLREGTALPFRRKLWRREQRHLLTPSTRSGTLRRGGWKMPKFTRDMAPPVTCGSRVGFVYTPTAENFFFPRVRDASTDRGCVSDTSQSSKPLSSAR